MKKCPACNRTFEDSFSFCLIDGSVLSAPFEPQAGHPDLASNEPPPTEVMSSEPLEINATSPSPISSATPTIRQPYQTAQPVSTASLEADGTSTKREQKPKLIVWMLGSIALLLVIVFAVIMIRSGSQSGTSNRAANASAEGTNSVGNISLSKTAAPSEADIIAKEKATWDTMKKKDYDAFGNMLTSDYLEVTDTGVIDKAATIADTKDINLTDVTFSDWKMLAIDNDAVILTYQITVDGTYKGEAVPRGPYRSAAVWVNRDGKWLAFYYQQTPVKPMPPAPPAASPSKTEKTATSSSGTPAQTGPDPIADEKIVWDLFKSKNYDGFAALLDSAFVELETTAVYDKAGAVKGVSEFDASQFELSEWKSAKLDNDAALVTYLVKPKDPKGDTERHTSIWANRGGKWLALLHVGTPVAKPAAKPDAKLDMKKM